MCIRVCVCACMDVQMHTCTSVYVCVHVCVCVCVSKTSNQILANQIIMTRYSLHYSFMNNYSQEECH